MATYSGQVRQGLPRVPGGEPWPKDGVAASSEPAHTGGTAASSPVSGAAPAPAETVTETAALEAAAPAEATWGAGSAHVVRQGLPRVPGGAPWPELGVAAQSEAGQGASAPAATAPAAEPAPAVEPVAPSRQTAPAEATPAELASAEPAPIAAGTPAASGGVNDVSVRRGLPRVAGGDAGPAEGFAPLWAVKKAGETQPEAAGVSAAAAEAYPAADSASDEETVGAKLVPKDAAEVQPEPVREVEPQAPATPPATQTPAPTAPAAKPEPAAPKPETVAQKPKPAVKPVREPVMIRGKQFSSWVTRGILFAIGAVVAAGILVLAARGVTTLPGVPEWMERYPGEYLHAVQADPGFPWWARWSHFLNIFLMVLIIRSGWHVRTQQQPPAFWIPKRGGKKISINLWLHTSLDVLWVVNGLIFVVLLFVSGHWARIVPTSWDVFPNAASAMLQYMALDWPAENGWVNYNALQQLMYFIIVFIAAPLAIITGVRMSEWWPEKADKLNKMYPAPLARAIHFPTMLFFVLFILVHVFLVLSTGALKNLNHMFAGQDVVNWTGFWLFALAIFVTAVGWLAARPLVLAPIASLFGRVSNR